MGGYGLLTAGSNWDGTEKVPSEGELTYSIQHSWVDDFPWFSLSRLVGYPDPWSFPEKYPKMTPKIRSWEKNVPRPIIFGIHVNVRGVGSDLEWWILHPFSLVVTYVYLDPQSYLENLGIFTPEVSHTIHGTCIFTYMNGLNLW